MLRIFFVFIYSRHVLFSTRYAFIHYTEESVCRAAHDSMQDHVYQSRTLVVMYGKKTSPDGDKVGDKRKAAASPAKGQLIHSFAQLIVLNVWFCMLLCMSVYLNVYLNVYL